VLLNRLAGLIALQNGCFLPGAIERRDALKAILRTRKLLCVSSPPVKVVSFEDLFGTCAKTAIKLCKGKNVVGKRVQIGSTRRSMYPVDVEVLQRLLE
jgi:hypothetical protein